MNARDTYNERDQLLLISQGSEAAFAVVVNRYKNNLYTSAFRVVGSKALAEDILQNVFLKLWVHREKLPGVTNFPGYLYTMAQHAIFDALRQTAQRRESELRADAEDGRFAHVDTERHLQEREYEAALHQAIESLPPRQKQTYRLIKEQGLRRDETAELMKVSTETVKFNLEQAVRKVRAVMLTSLKLFF